MQSYCTYFFNYYGIINLVYIITRNGTANGIDYVEKSVL